MRPGLSTGLVATIAFHYESMKDVGTAE